MATSPRSRQGCLSHAQPFSHLHAQGHTLPSSRSDPRPSRCHFQRSSRVPPLASGAVLSCREGAAHGLLPSEDPGCTMERTGGRPAGCQPQESRPGILGDLGAPRPQMRSQQTKRTARAWPGTHSETAQPSLNTGRRGGPPPAGLQVTCPARARSTKLVRVTLRKQGQGQRNNNNATCRSEPHIPGTPLGTNCPNTSIKRQTLELPSWLSS